MSESGLGDGAFTSGDGTGLLRVGFNSSSFLFKFFTLVENALYA